jgi:hypothetical protein
MSDMEMENSIPLNPAFCLARIHIQRPGLAILSFHPQFAVRQSTEHHFLECFPTGKVLEQFGLAHFLSMLRSQ